MFITEVVNRTKTLQLENKLLWFGKNMLDYRDAEINTGWSLPLRNPNFFVFLL